MIPAVSLDAPDGRRKPPLIIVGPLPPPVHGVAVSTDLALQNPLLRERFDVEHIDTTDRRPVSTMQRWDVTNVVLGLRNVRQLLKRLRSRRGIVYLPLSAYLGAFLRDSIFIQVSALAGWSVAVHIRNSTFRDFYDARHPLAKWWIRVTLARISTVAVLGPRMRPAFDGLVPQDRVAVVPNGTPDVPRLDVPRDPNLVLYLSNLLRRKGVVEAVEAALMVVRQVPEARVLFVGEWEDELLEQELVDRARPGGDRIRFQPPTTGEEKEKLLQSCSVLLFPPKEKEGHPRIVLEAICRGIPLVTTDRATITDTVTDGDGAFVLDRPDPVKLSERVVQLLADQQLREETGRAARSRYESAYTQELADRQLADWLMRKAR
jgi:glycosyltransferase involved in cell wall biosynthesis